MIYSTSLGMGAHLELSTKKPIDNRLSQLPIGFIECFDLSAAKWSRWEKREDLSVLLHKPLIDPDEP
ncbi:hypothetical protein [Rubripirellula obstinata]|nr:hypothetical protein [Rubripirellula obstinata]